jgi:hypothetical protein
MSTVVQAQAISSVFAVGDPGSTRLVLGAVALLVVVGLALIATSLWLWRETRIDDPVLLPLERMGERDFQRADPVFQRRMLDDARPPGAIPLHDSAPLPEPDPDFERGPDPAGLDGILDGVESERNAGGDDASVAPVDADGAEAADSHGSPRYESRHGRSVEGSDPEPETSPEREVGAPVGPVTAGAVSLPEPETSGADTAAVRPPDGIDVAAAPLNPPVGSDDEVFVDPGLGPPR